MRSFGQPGDEQVGRAASTCSPETADTGTMSAKSPSRDTDDQLLGDPVRGCHVGLGDDRDSGSTQAGQLGCDEPVAGADSLVRRHAETDDVDVGERGPHHVVEPLAQQGARAVQPGRVDEHELGVRSGDDAAHRVPGRLRLALVMTILLPTKALVSVDFPALGRPTKQQKPDRKLTRPWSQTAGRTRPGSDQ